MHQSTTTTSLVLTLALEAFGLSLSNNQTKTSNEFIRCFHQFVWLIFSMSFSQFEQLKKKTNFLLVQNSGFLSLPLDSWKRTHNKSLLNFLFCTLGIQNWWNYLKKNHRKKITMGTPSPYQEQFWLARHRPYKSVMKGEYKHPLSYPTPPMPIPPQTIPVASNLLAITYAPSGKDILRYGWNTPPISFFWNYNLEGRT